MSPDIACLRPVTSCPPASLPTGPRVAGDLPLVCWERPPWGLLEQDFRALEKMMPLALGSTETIFSSQTCFSSCSVHSALPSSLLDSKPQEHFSCLYALVFLCKVPSILSSHLPPSYPTAQVLGHSPLLVLLPLLVSADIVPHRTHTKQSSGAASTPHSETTPGLPLSRIRLTSHVWGLPWWLR